MFIASQRYFRYFDWISFCLSITLSVCGLIFVFSATYTEHYPYSIFFKKQALGIISGIFIYLLFTTIDYRLLSRFGYFVFWAIGGLLIFTLIKGSIGMGAQRWINVLLFKFQPSELAKLFFPGFITYYLYTNHDNSQQWYDFLPLFSILMITVVLIIKQPDLGTGLIILFSGLILLWFAGLSSRFFILFFGCFILTAPLFWHILKPYQKNRITVFLGAGQSNKERYQLEQSKIAIGSGGLFGKGLTQGTQNRLMFLPEGRTDFIFAILCEEWGFAGAFIILLLYGLLCFRLIFIAYIVTNFYAQLLICGLMIHIILSALINIGMVTGLLPIVGIPLPLMSYGVSNLWITFASLGWINGIQIRQFYIGE
ncbi:MAG: FtsW/RodA/SpoVE family cell cycle protein [Candidatus Babeliales bacterium]